MKVSELHDRVKKCGLTLNQFACQYGLAYGSMAKLGRGVKPMSMSKIEERLEMLEKGKPMPRPHKIV